VNKAHFRSEAHIQRAHGAELLNYGGNGVAHGRGSGYRSDHRFAFGAVTQFGKKRCKLIRLNQRRSWVKSSFTRSSCDGSGEVFSCCVNDSVFLKCLVGCLCCGLIAATVTELCTDFET
jgi:hypothetical protein